MPSEKKHWIEYLRIYGILGVLCVHISANFYSKFGTVSTADWWFANLVSSTFKGAVCFFVMISGALLLGREHDLNLFYRKRVLRIIPPLIFWSVVFIFFRAWHGENLAWLLKYNLLIKGKANGHLWFLPMFLILMMFVPFISSMITGRKATQKELKVLLLVIAGIFCLDQISGFIAGLKNYHMHWFLTFLPFIPYLIAGYYLDQYADSIRLNNGLLALIFCAVTAVGMALNYVACNRFGFFNDDFILGFSGILVLLKSCCVFYFFRKNGPAFQKSSACLGMADAVFGIYLVHPLFQWFVQGKLPDYYSHGILYLPFVIAAVFVLSYLATNLIKKVPLGKYVV